ncbi:MAG: thioredoxin [Eubacteriales bacterium]|nr:thioredoxin [Eubacteriales bacterium]
MVKKIENNNITEIEAAALAVVDFSASWCGPCKMLAPVIDELAEEMTDVAFFNVDVDDNAELAVKYGIQSVPSVFLMKNGEIAARSIGFQPKAQMQAWIASNK